MCGLHEGPHHVLPPSSSGPGRRPLKAVTAVQIRSGVLRSLVCPPRRGFRVSAFGEGGGGGRASPNGILRPRHHRGGHLAPAVEVGACLAPGDKAKLVQDPRHVVTTVRGLIPSFWAIRLLVQHGTQVEHLQLARGQSVIPVCRDEVGIGTWSAAECPPGGNRAARASTTAGRHQQACGSSASCSGRGSSMSTTCGVGETGRRAAIATIGGRSRRNQASRAASRPRRPRVSPPRAWRSLSPATRRRRDDRPAPRGSRRFVGGQDAVRPDAWLRLGSVRGDDHRSMCGGIRAICALERRPRRGTG